MLNDVRRALALPRPGRDAQMRLAPRPRWGDPFPLPPEFQPREAGVLILLYPDNGGLSFFLMRRTDTVETHKGQISLPGGAREPGETLAQTARRETCEELGVTGASIEILGDALTPLDIPVSGFRATPFVAYTPTHPPLHVSACEVHTIIETPLDWIVDERYLGEEEWVLHGYPAIVPFFKVNGYQVWGATAMMLSELGEMLRRVK